MTPSTTKKRILLTLIHARRGKRFTFYGRFVPAGWVPLRIIVAPEIGGSEGCKRIREMNASGIHIEKQVFSVQTANGKQRTWLRRLITDPELIDVNSCRPKLTAKVA